MVQHEWPSFYTLWFLPSISLHCLIYLIYKCFVSYIDFSLFSVYIISIYLVYNISILIILNTNTAHMMWALFWVQCCQVLSPWSLSSAMPHDAYIHLHTCIISHSSVTGYLGGFCGSAWVAFFLYSLVLSSSGLYFIYNCCVCRPFLILVFLMIDYWVVLLYKL